MPRKVEEIVLDGNSQASRSTSETPQIAYDRRPDSALIAEFRTAQNAHFSKPSRADTTVRGESGDSVAGERWTRIQLIGNSPDPAAVRLPLF
jgi:hypothetical protein